MDAFKIWNKRVGKFSNIMFKNKKKITVTMKTCKACKIQVSIFTNLLQLSQVFLFLLFLKLLQMVSCPK